MKKAFRDGFSLVELMVVIAVVAVLCAMLLPALNNAREVSYQAKCAAGARQVDLGCKNYAAENRNYYPSSFANTFVFPVNPSLSYPVASMNYQEQMVTQGYLPKNIFTRQGGCPYGPSVYSSSHWNPQSAATNTVAYGINGRLISGPGALINTSNNGQGVGMYGPMRMDRLRAGRHPSLLGTILDSANPGTQPNDARLQINEMGYRVAIGTTDQSHWRHKAKGLNIAFYDGHVTFVPRQAFLDFGGSEYIGSLGGAATTPDYMYVTFNGVYSTYRTNWIDGQGAESVYRWTP